MAIPDYQSLMLPLLQHAADGQLHRTRDVADILGDQLGLTEDEHSELLPSGGRVLVSRAWWARTYLRQAGLMEVPKRGYHRITAAGRELLAQCPEKIDNALLRKYPAFQEFLARDRKKESTPETANEVTESAETPEDALHNAYQQLRAEIESEILTQLKGNSPYFFERAVIDLLFKMGYGGNRQDAAKAVGKSGDGGIDGIINEDKLGLDVIYIQAKRWEGTVGRPEIQKFAGALQGKRAKKGVFISTSSFTKDALEYAANIDTRIILIGGERLAQLMVDHDVGVSTAGSYEIKKIDSDYFDE